MTRGPDEVAGTNNSKPVVGGCRRTHVLGQTLEMDDNDRTPVMPRLEPFVGRWTMEALFPGADPTGPAGLSTFEWILEGQFLLQRTEFSVPGPPEGVMIVGPDPVESNFTQHYFDSRGVVRVYAMTLDKTVWTLQRESPDFTPLNFAQRFTDVISDDGLTIEGHWETRHDSNWEHRASPPVTGNRSVDQAYVVVRPRFRE